MLQTQLCGFFGMNGSLGMDVLISTTTHTACYCDHYYRNGMEGWSSSSMLRKWIVQCHETKCSAVRKNNYLAVSVCLCHAVRGNSFRGWGVPSHYHYHPDPHAASAVVKTAWWVIKKGGLLWVSKENWIAKKYIMEDDRRIIAEGQKD